MRCEVYYVLILLCAGCSGIGFEKIGNFRSYEECYLEKKALDLTVDQAIKEFICVKVGEK